MRFTKMHGAGNDFIIINNIEEHIPEERLGVLAKQLCAFHTSIGADGMMAVIPPKNGGDYGMMFFNSDGSLGEMCGNGARCICRWGYENGLAGETQRVETTAGLVTGERIDRRRYRIRLNDPSVIDLHRSVTVDGTEYDCCYIELGCPGLPHAVVRLDGFDKMDENELRKLGRALRSSPAFPKGANVNFVELTGRDALRIKTFERGVEDFTLACGTGCGSSVAALTLSGQVSGRDVTLQSPGGVLNVTLTQDGGTVQDIYLTGPTNIVCIGEVTDEDLNI